MHKDTFTRTKNSRLLLTQVPADQWPQAAPVSSGSYRFLRNPSSHYHFPSLCSPTLRKTHSSWEKDNKVRPDFTEDPRAVLPQHQVKSHSFSWLPLTQALPILLTPAPTSSSDSRWLQWLQKTFLVPSSWGLLWIQTLVNPFDCLL